MKTLKDAQEEAKNNLGFSFAVPADLSPADREVLYDTEADIILKSPNDYAANVVAWANKRRNGSFYGVPYKDYSFTDGVSDFVEEVGNQAVDLNNNLNPFSEKNRKWVLGVAAVGVLAYFLLPVVINALRKKAE